MAKMEDIRVDDDGNLRCASCGGKNFHGRRTARAHVIGYVTVGIGALATQKKLRCQECGAYNKQGNAQPWREKGEPGWAKFGSQSAGGGATLPAGVQYVRVDDDDDFRCWYCGNTLPASAAESWITRPKCSRCGFSNDMSNPSPWDGPVSKKNWD